MTALRQRQRDGNDIAATAIVGWRWWWQQRIGGDSLAAAVAAVVIVQRRGGNSAAAAIARRLQSAHPFWCGISDYFLVRLMD